MKSPIVLLTYLFADVKRLVPHVKGLDRDIITIEARFEHEGYSFLSVAFSTLCDALDEGLTKGCFTCPTGFRKIRKGAIPRLFSGLLCDVFDAITGHLKQDPDLGSIKCLREILRLFKKATCDTTRQAKLEAIAVDSFFETEASVIRELPDTQAHFLKDVCRFILLDLQDVDLREIACKHGPGATRERVAGNQKWSLVLQSLYGIDVAEYGYDVFLSSLRTEENGYDLPDVPEREYFSRRSARLITVDKNSTSRRTITVEPVLSMFIQQGLNTLLRDSISQCEVLNNCLALTDQSANQKLALEGSLTGEWATLDLSSASDLLGLKLVELVFAKCSRFLSATLECRSTHVQFGGDTPRAIAKFAGMGNALTFPVQSVVFATIAIAAILQRDGKRPSHKNVVQASRCVRVYGDDIIVRTSHSHVVVDWLHSFGLKVNTRKSFMEGNFRESCGVDAFTGVDVTPVYLRTRPDIFSTEPDAIASLVSTSNQLWMRCLYSASAALRLEVEMRLSRRLPLVPIKSGALGWHSRTDACAAQRWDAKLQRLVFKAPVIIPVEYRDSIDGYAALLKFFHVPLLGRGPKHLKQSQRRFSSRIVWRWMPAEAG
jgi:hypothetical protein